LTATIPTTGSFLPFGPLTDLTTLLSFKEKNLMAPSEHPMARRLVDAMGVGLDVGAEELSFD
jgi:hypothetical protein